MDGGPETKRVERGRITREMRRRAAEALQSSDLSELLELAGSDSGDGAASAALKSILAERMTAYAIQAMREAKRRGTKVGAATIIIAAAGR